MCSHDNAPEHDPYTYVVEEHTHIVSRNYFILKYLEAITHEKFDS